VEDQGCIVTPIHTSHKIIHKTAENLVAVDVIFQLLGAIRPRSVMKKTVSAMNKVLAKRSAKSGPIESIFKNKL
jgi:hypothetical protein